MAELQFAPGTGTRAAEALADLARATNAEPGCRRYVAARDLADPDRFHLSELWDDIAALADHFATPHMAVFSATAQVLGYSAPFLKRIAIAELGELKPAELKSLRGAACEPQLRKGKSGSC
ncbi:MAG TPA: putative quinol monooxygenase [Sphingomicrobium sp.]